MCRATYEIYKNIFLVIKMLYIQGSEEIIVHEQFNNDVDVKAVSITRIMPLDSVTMRAPQP